LAKLLPGFAWPGLCSALLIGFAWLCLALLVCLTFVLHSFFRRVRGEWGGGALLGFAYSPPPRKAAFFKKRM